MPLTKVCMQETIVCTEKTKVCIEKTKMGISKKGILVRDALVCRKRVASSYAVGKVPAVLCVPPPPKLRPPAPTFSGNHGLQL